MINILSAAGGLKKVGGQILGALAVLSALGWFVINVIFPAIDKGVGVRAEISQEIKEAEYRSKTFAIEQRETLMLPIQQIRESQDRIEKRIDALYQMRVYGARVEEEDEESKN